MSDTENDSYPSRSFGRGRGGGRGRGRDDRRENGEDSYGRGGGFRNERDGDRPPRRDRDGGDRGFGERNGGYGDRGFGERNGGYGDRGGHCDRDRNGGEDGADEKPREKYVPPEPSNDENVIFGSGISSGINFDKYDDISIKVTGERPVPPIDSFDSAQLRPFVLDNVKRSGYSKPTPVQKNAIPTVMAGRDLMACAQTGSGKTAAFLIPIINALLSDPAELVTTSEGCQPQAIILSPTRELAIQIHDEARKFAHGSTLKVKIVYGGTVSYHQAQSLMSGVHILVATPGRLNDFVDRGRVSFESVRFFVLDEADRMLDMGFLPAVERMMDHPSMVPKEDRQTLMFSATFPDEIQRLAGKFLNTYIFLAVGVVGGACADVEQVILKVPQFEKKQALSDLLTENGGVLTLVFVEQKRNCDFVAAYLCENSFPTTSIHGDRLQSQREQALRDFKNGHKPTLVATAVAARGLDIKNVAHVVNYDLPSSIDEYVHRIGRTGRVGNRGRATSFFDPAKDRSIAADLVRILTQSGQEIPSFLQSELEGGGDFGGNGGDDFGGRDYRKSFRNQDDGSRASAVPQAQEEEEEW